MEPAAADDQGWAALFVTGPVAKDSSLLLWFQAHARFSGVSDDLDVMIVRPGLDLWAGCARVDRHLPNRNIVEERLWQPATYGIAQPWGSTLTGRTRLEQRFRSEDTGWRVRQFIRFARPISASGLSLVATNALFVGLNDTRWGQRSGYDQNRAFVGGAWQASGKLRIEAGYMNQNINGASANETRDNAVLSAFVALWTPSTNKNAYGWEAARPFSGG